MDPHKICGVKVGLEKPFKQYLGNFQEIDILNWFVLGLSYFKTFKLLLLDKILNLYFISWIIYSEEKKSCRYIFKYLILYKKFTVSANLHFGKGK